MADTKGNAGNASNTGPTPEAKAGTPETRDAKGNVEKPVSNKPETNTDDEGQTWVSYRQTWTDNDGNLKEKEHRVKSEDWAEYEKEHGF